MYSSARKPRLLCTNLKWQWNLAGVNKCFVYAFYNFIFWAISVLVSINFIEYPKMPHVLATHNVVSRELLICIKTTFGLSLLHICRYFRISLGSSSVHIHVRLLTYYWCDGSITVEAGCSLYIVHEQTSLPFFGAHGPHFLLQGGEDFVEYSCKLTHIKFGIHIFFFIFKTLPGNNLKCSIRCCSAVVVGKGNNIFLMCS